MRLCTFVNTQSWYNVRFDNKIVNNDSPFGCWVIAPNQEGQFHEKVKRNERYQEISDPYAVFKQYDQHKRKRRLFEMKVPNLRRF